MLVLKETVEIGDNIKYKHPISHPFEDRCTCIPGTVIGINGDVYRIRLQFGAFAKDEIEIDASKEALIVTQQIPNPNWLSEKLAKATRIKEANWSGAYLYDDDSREYFESSEDLYEHYASNDALDNLPDYCFGTKPVIFKVSNAEDLVADLYSSGEEDIDLQRIDEFQQAIDTFNEINRSTMTHYYPDYSTVVILDLPKISD